jgi:predicted 3-demethylubiquinone-9 3-methyltransferase (glyoxalase superfamily)
MKQKVVTFLWFNDNAEEAMKFYLKVFKKSKKLAITRWGDVGPGPKGSVLTVAFELEGQQYVALNGGPTFKFTEAISLLINCDTQKEIDYYWYALSKGGEKSQCGWLKDKFGLSWQVAPRKFMNWLKDKDTRKVDRFMAAMMTMTRLDLAKLEAAYKGK